MAFASGKRSEGEHSRFSVLGSFFSLIAIRGIWVKNLRSRQSAVRSGCQQLESICTEGCIPDGMYLTKANEILNDRKYFENA
jgi:hypothetical protein